MALAGRHKGRGFSWLASWVRPPPFSKGLFHNKRGAEMFNPLFYLLFFYFFSSHNIPRPGGVQRGTAENRFINRLTRFISETTSFQSYSRVSVVGANEKIGIVLGRKSSTKKESGCGDAYWFVFHRWKVPESRFHAGIFAIDWKIRSNRIFCSRSTTTYRSLDIHLSPKPLITIWYIEQIPI